MNTRRAFTLIELLTVIAIIAILAAIIFPVYARAKDSANRSSDIASMNNLRSALALYKIDQGGYPPQLLGYVNYYTSGPNAGSPIPAGSILGYLYPKRDGSIHDFQPVNDRAAQTDIVNTGIAGNANVVFPNQDPTAVGTRPILDLNGDGAITAADDPAGARQAFGPADGAVCWSPAVNAVIAGANCSTGNPIQFYSVSGYDVATVPTTTGGTQTELRYSRFWTNYSLVGVAGVYGASDDDPRQLGYNEPPEDTVITWNSYYRDFVSTGVPAHEKRDIVLYLSGTARPFDSKNAFDYSWRQDRAR